MIKNEKFTISQNDQMLKNIFIQTKQVNSEKQCIIPDIDSGTIICIAADCLSIDDVRKLGQLEHEKRIYILLGDADNPRNRDAIKHLAGNCLIRTGVTQSGTLVLIDGNTSQSRAWIYPSDGFTGELGIETTSSESERLYQTFCYLFWKKTVFEYYSNNKEPRDIQSETNPIIEISTDLPCSLPGELDPFIIVETEDCNTVDIITPAENCDWMNRMFSQRKEYGKVIFTLSKERQPQNLEAFCLHSRRAYLSEQTGRNMSVVRRGNDEKEYYLPENPSADKTNWIYVCEKTSNAFTDYPQHWTLNKNCAIKDLQTNLQIRFADQPGKIITIANTLQINLGDIHTDTMDNFCQNTRDICEEKGLMDFRRDRIAHDILYSVVIHPPYLPNSTKPEYLGWDTFQKNWIDTLQIMKEKIVKHKKEKSVWNSIIKGRLQGKEHMFDECMEEINKLYKFDFTHASPSFRKENLERHTMLWNKIEQLILDSRKEKKLVDGQEEWDKETDNIQEDIDKLKLSLEKEKNEDDMKRIKEKIDRKETDKAKHQEQRPKSASDTMSDSFGKVAGIIEGEGKPPVFTLPKEDLPKEGFLLYREATHRYLVISSIDELHDAKIDAKRLNAKICSRKTTE